MDSFGWIGHVIDGRFAVEELAGEGAFGVVYRGRHLALDEPVAVKCLKVSSPLEASTREEFVQAFRSEARLLHRLSRQTAHIVQALDVGAAESPSGTWTPYIVMEWLAGESLEAELSARSTSGLPPRPAADAISYLTPVAEALSLAHAEGVVHRDVKPGNVFVAKVRGGEMLKLLDFGIAKVLAETSAGATTLSSAGLGVAALTPQYAAPEQFNAHYGATGPWTDVFALALVFLEVVTGRRALVGSDLIQLYIASSDEVVRPSARAHGVLLPARLEAVLGRALAVQPADRYPHAGAFWAAVRGAAGVVSGPALAPTVASPIAESGAPTLVLDTPKRVAEEPSSTPSRPVAGEHRVCTVVFVDLVGLDRLAEHLEADEVAAVARSCIAAINETVEAHGGVIDRASADRVMAVFGIPRAREDDPERAVRAGLAMADAVLRAVTGRRGLGRVRLGVRVGIHTGRVFVGGAGATTGEALAVLGEAVNLAARVHQSAPAGRVVLSSTTHLATDGAFLVERISDPLLEREGHVLRAVIAPADGAPSSFDFCGLQTRTVGRSVERARLLEILETAQAEGRAQVVTLSGEAGVGKSRLVDDLVRQLAGDARVEIVSGRATPRWQTSELSLLRDVLRNRFSIRDEDTMDTVRDKLGRAGRDPLSAGDRELAAFLSARVEHDVPSSQSGMVPDDAGVEARARLRGAVISLFEQMSEERTVALVCDDVQWADDASLDLLDELSAQLSARPIFVLCVARSDLYERRPRWGEGRAAHTRVIMDRLASRHIAELVRDRLRRVEPLPEEVVRLLTERADGSPLILEETLLLLVDAGVLAPGDDRWRLEREALTSLVLPPTVLGLIQARLDRLAPEVRHVLAQASVIGRVFWAEALAELVQAEADAADVDVTEALLVLRDRRLVRAREASLLAGKSELVFADGAVHEVAYASLRARSRARQHARMAAWLEREAEGDAMLAEIANHLDLSGDVRGAARAHTRAGIRAGARGRHEEALRHLERAAALHEIKIDEAPLDVAAPADDVEDLRVATWQERATVCLELGDVMRRLGRLDEAISSYEQARRLLLRREARKGQALDPSGPLRFEARVDLRLALTHKLRGQSADARRTVERAIDLATRAGAEEETAAMWALLAGVHRREGDLAACREASLRGLRVSRNALRDDAQCAAISSLLVSLGAVFYSQGRLVRAERCYRQAARVLDERTQPERLSSAVCNIAAVRFALGDWSGARQSFVRSLELSERAGNLHSAAIALSNMAEVDLKLGRVESALAAARRSVELGERVDAKSDLPDMMRNFAEALAASGRLLEALQTARGALALARVGAGRVYLDAVVRTLSELGRGRDEASEPALDEARRLAMQDLRACVAEEGLSPDLLARSSPAT